MSTKTTVTIELIPFAVPSSVTEKQSQVPAFPPMPVQAPAPQRFGSEQHEWSEPYIGQREFKLSELSAETLHEMCDEFRSEVFKRAGKELGS